MKKLYKIETIISFKEYLKIKQFFKNSFKKIILIDILLIIVSFFIFIKDLNIIFLFCSMSILILYLNFILICLTTMFNYYHYCKKRII